MNIRLYATLRLNYTLRLWTLTLESRAVSAVAELLAKLWVAAFDSTQVNLTQLVDKNRQFSVSRSGLSRLSDQGRMVAMSGCSRPNQFCKYAIVM